jgi:hypothetical protein
MSALAQKASPILSESLSGPIERGKCQGKCHYLHYLTSAARDSVTFATLLPLFVSFASLVLKARSRHAFHARNSKLLMPFG